MKRILTFLVLLFTAATAAAQSSSSSTSGSTALGNDYKVNVLAASAGANIDLTQINFTLTTIDGVVITAGNQRFLAKDQTNPAQNGIYVSPGTNGAAAVRATDANSWVELPGAQVTAAGGTTNAGKIFTCTAAATGTLGTTAVPWIAAGGGGGGAVAYQYALSDEDTDLTVNAGATAKLSVRMPYAFTLTGVRASVLTAPVGAAVKVDIKQGGVSVLSTQISIDSSALTSVGSAAPAVISTAALTDDAVITFHVTQIGTTTAGKGLKVTLYLTR